jgi:D-threo-aldose 1-dehydrogenase
VEAITDRRPHPPWAGSTLQFIARSLEQGEGSMNPFAPVSLGKSNLLITRLGLGCGPLAGLFSDVPESQAVSTIRRALQAGVKFIDTAPLYGLGKSEARVGKALQGADRSAFVLATKVGRMLVPDEKAPQGEYINTPPVRAIFDYSYDAVMRSYEASLRRLNLDRIDILHIHDPDDHWEDAMRGAYPALHKLREHGAIRAISAGMNQPEMLARFAREADFDCFLLASCYTLLVQSALAELFPLCLQKRIGIICGAPYNSGILATGAQEGARFSYKPAPPEIMERVRKIESACATYHVPLKAAALQFPLAHPAVTTVIPGSRSETELEENIQAVGFPIPSSFWAELKDRNLLPSEAPVPSY